MAQSPLNSAQQVDAWKSLGSSLLVEILGDSGGQSRGDIYLQRWDRRDRMVRALQYFGACWGLAIFCIALPILHFFLVPGLLIAGPLLGFYIFDQASVVLGGFGKCPKCSEELKIERGPEKFPMKDVCSRCYENVRVQPFAS